MEINKILWYINIAKDIEKRRIIMYLSPKETLEYLEEVSVKKKKRPISQLFVLAIFAGMAIGFGAIASVLASGAVSKVDYGMGKLIAGAVFPVGLIFVVLAQLELFTSNCLMVVGVKKKRIKWTDMLKVLCLVWIGNLLGSLIVSAITAQTHTLNDVAQSALIYANKARITAPTINIFLKAVLANILVAGGAFCAYAAKDWAGKMLACWFFIMLFTVLGYDHSIANMTYLPTALLLGADLPIHLVVHNIFVATIGNFVGGAIVGMGFLYVHGK